jgi:hypothetical protein
MRVFYSLAAIGVAALVAVSCRTPEQPAAPETAAPRPVATLEELMEVAFEDNAYRIFDSVVITINADGITEKRPTTDEEWEEVLHALLALAEGPNLIVNVGQDGRRVGNGDELGGGAEGELSPGEIQARINEKRDLWVKYATDLQAVTREAIDIAKKKDAQGLFDAGGRINQACETCHEEFWFRGLQPQP